MNRTCIDFPDFEYNFKNYDIILLNVMHDPPRNPWAVEPHSHTGFEFHFVTSGKGRLYLNGEEHMLSEDVFYITGPDVIHSQTSENEGSQEEYGFTLDISSKGEPETEFESLLENIVRNPDFFTKRKTDGGVICRAIIEEAKKKETGFREKIGCLLCALLTDIGRIVGNTGNSLYSGTVNARVNRIRVLDDFLRRYRGNISSSEIAGKLNISKRQLSRIIRTQYNMTLTEKINQMRVEYAKTLLVSSRMSVNKISELSGFTSAQYFCRIFGKLTGLTPASYRKSRVADAEF